MTTTDYLPHDGKAMPVDPEALVKVKFRDDRNPSMAAKACWWHGIGDGPASCWIHDGSAADIVSYRVIE